MENKGNGKGFAIASLVLGICGLVLPYVGTLSAIIGLVLGILGKKKLTEAGEPSGMATAGIVLSIIGLAGSILIIIICGGLLAAAGTAANSADMSSIFESAAAAAVIGL